MPKGLKILSIAAVLAAPLPFIGASSASASPTRSYTCTGVLGDPGTVLSGTYRALNMPEYSVCQIVGNVYVNAPVHIGYGAGLLAVSGSLTINGALTLAAHSAFGAGVGNVPNDVPLTINGPVHVGTNAALVIGQEDPYTPIFAHVNGAVSSTNASSVQIHNSAVFGPVQLTGGGGDNAILDYYQGFGPFNDLEDNTIAGTVSETGYRGEWAGVLRNIIKGSFTFSNNSEAPNIDEYDIGSNRINGPATCNSNDPTPNEGQSAGYLSIVTGPTSGNQAETCTGVPWGGSGPPV